MSESQQSNRSRLLWPAIGERILACSHSANLDAIEVFAFLKSHRYHRPGGPIRRARYYVLCRDCVTLRAGGTPVADLLHIECTWTPPEGVEVPIPFGG